MDKYSCGNCNRCVNTTFTKTVHHNICFHSNANILIKVQELDEKNGQMVTITRDYGPSEPKGNIYIDKNREIIYFSDDEHVNTSDNEHLNTETRNITNSDTDTASESDTEKNTDSYQDPNIHLAQSLIPHFAEKLNTDQISTFTSFLNMVVSFLCILDTVKYCSLKSITLMKFSPAVKHFFGLGSRLFHGSYLRYHAGDRDPTTNEDTLLCQADPQKINFAVPSLGCLRKDTYKCDEPGIIVDLIKDVANISSPKDAFILTADEKSLNRGRGKRCGDANTWGYGTSPNLEERRNRLTLEQNKIDNTIRLLQSRCLDHPVLIIDLPIDLKVALTASLKDIIHILSQRTRELKKESCILSGTVQRLQKQAGPDWRKSRFLHAISGLRTKWFEVDQAIKDNLQV